MKLTIVPIAICIGRVGLQIKSPGIVRHVAFESKPKLVMTRGQPDFEETPVIFVEASPQGPLVNRIFVAITHNESIDVDENETAKWVGTGVSGRGTVVHVFEMIEKA